VASLVDTNILVYRCDPRDPQKQSAAWDILRHGFANDELRIPHQALVEFMNVVTRQKRGAQPMLPLHEAFRQSEELMDACPVLYPNAEVFHTALWGMATYQLAWYDAHLWAYAECHGLPEILSEDFEHGRKYGGVRIRNPFLAFGLV
jgi:predicted nucleic acid-binding protein